MNPTVSTYETIATTTKETTRTVFERTPPHPQQNFRVPFQKNNVAFYDIRQCLLNNIPKTTGLADDLNLLYRSTQITEKARNRIKHQYKTYHETFMCLKFCISYATPKLTVNVLITTPRISQIIKTTHHKRDKNFHHLNHLQKFQKQNLVQSIYKHSDPLNFTIHLIAPKKQKQFPVANNLYGIITGIFANKDYNRNFVQTYPVNVIKNN